MNTQDEHSRHPKNAPGPFYVEGGCCLQCMAPHAEAPVMMGFDEKEGHCYVRQQPKTEEEIYQAICAVWASDVGCLRYAGSDREILRRLAEAGCARYCNQPVPEDAKPTLRNHVTFEAKSVEAEQAEVTKALLVSIAASLRASILGRNSSYNSYAHTTVTPVREAGDAVTFAYSWGYDQHELTVTLGEPDTNRVLISHSPTIKPGSYSVSLRLDDWLRSEGRFASIRWYTAQAWQRSRSTWQETPV